MVLLGSVELIIRLDRDHDGLLERPRFRKLCFRCFRNALLLLVVVENDRAILRSAVGELAAGIGRVDGVPVHFEELLVGDDIGIVDHLDRFNPVGPPGSDVVVGWIRRGATGEPGDGSLHTANLLQGGFRAPEASACERCLAERGVGADRLGHDGALGKGVLRPVRGQRGRNGYGRRAKNDQCVSSNLPHGDVMDKYVEIRRSGSPGTPTRSGS